MIIRKFREKDRKEIEQICISQSEHPNSKKKCAVVKNLFLNYYLDYEPDNVLVAENKGEICGYIVASAEKELFQQQMNTKYIAKIAKTSILMKIFGKICAKFNRKQDNLGGVGFHINIKKGYERQGIGSKLLSALGLLMKNKNKKFLYLITKNKQTTGYAYYSHIGFSVKKTYCFGSVLMTKNI